jgi:hypothetical protein
MGQPDTSFGIKHGFSRAFHNENENTPKAVRPRGTKGVNELQFRIKDQDYFLAFVEQEKRWYVFSPTPQGVHRIPVYVDAEKYGSPEMLGTKAGLLS